MANQQSAPSVSLPDVYEVKADSANTVTHTGDTEQTTLKSYTIPAGLLGVDGAIRFRAAGEVIGEGAQKYVIVMFGVETIGYIVIPGGAGTKSWQLSGAIHNLSAENDQSGSILAMVDTAISLNDSSVETIQDTSVAQDIKVCGQLFNAGDSILITDFTIEINRS